MARCDDFLLIMFSVHVIMMFIIRDDSYFTVNLLFEIDAHYVNVLTLKCLQIQSQSMYFSKFSWGHASRPA